MRYLPQKFTSNGREITLGTHCKVIFHNMSSLQRQSDGKKIKEIYRYFFFQIALIKYYRRDAERYGIFAFITGYFSLRNSALAVWAWGKGLIFVLNVLCSRRFSHDCFDLFAVLRVDLTAILRAHQHGSKIESRVFQARSMAFYYSRC